MNIKTPEQIAREAALAVLNEYDAELVHDGECPLSALGWETGEGITYEDAFESIVRHAIEADRAQRETPVVVIRDGQGYADDAEVDLIDLDFLGPHAVSAHSDYDQTDIDLMLAALEGAGFASAAADVREWWAER